MLNSLFAHGTAHPHFPRVSSSLLNVHEYKLKNWERGCADIFISTQVSPFDFVKKHLEGTLLDSDWTCIPLIAISVYYWVSSNGARN